jgi:hypothetical protein
MNQKKTFRKLKENLIICNEDTYINLDPLNLKYDENSSEWHNIMANFSAKPLHLNIQEPTYRILPEDEPEYTGHYVHPGLFRALFGYTPVSYIVTFCDRYIDFDDDKGVDISIC